MLKLKPVLFTQSVFGFSFGVLCGLFALVAGFLSKDPNSVGFKFLDMETKGANAGIAICIMGPWIFFILFLIWSFMAWSIYAIVSKLFRFSWLNVPFKWKQSREKVTFLGFVSTQAFLGIFYGLSIAFLSLTLFFMNGGYDIVSPLDFLKFRGGIAVFTHFLFDPILFCFVTSLLAMVVYLPCHFLYRLFGGVFFESWIYLYSSPK